MERRRVATSPNELAPSLPKDYLRLVEDVLAKNFSVELEKLAENGRSPVFEAVGQLYPTEVVLAVSLMQASRIGATTVHASSDFEFGDNAPAEAEARLCACLDAIGGVFSELLAPEAMPRLRLGTLATLSEVPVGWSEAQVRDRTVYVLVDSSNPRLEAMTDEWLKAHEIQESELPTAHADSESDTEEFDSADDEVSSAEEALPPAHAQATADAATLSELPAAGGRPRKPSATH